MELFKLEKSEANKPLVLGGRRIYLVLNGYGSFSAPLIRYEPEIDFGGVWIPGYKIAGPIFFGLEIESTIRNLEDFFQYSFYKLSHFEAHFEVNEGKIIQHIFPAMFKPCAFIVFDFNKIRPKKFTIAIELWMAPMQAYGIVAKKIKHVISRNVIQISDGIFKASFVFNTTPTSVQIIDDRDNVPESLLSKTNTTANPKYLLIQFDKMPEDMLIFMVYIGSKKDAKKLINDYGSISDLYRYELKNREEYLENLLLKRLVRIEVPDNLIQKAYISAILALEMLKSEHPDGSFGVMAGLPWFGSFWSRDTGWILPALILLNDYDAVEKAIDTMLKFQLKFDIKMLKGVRGALPVSINYITPPSYQCSDGPFYYPILIEELIEATGNLNYAKRWWENIKMTFQYGLSKDMDKDGFIETKVDKYTLSDHTWMDSEDRSKKPIEIQALWIRSLNSIANIAEIVGDKAIAKQASDLYLHLRNVFHTLFWNGDNYYYDTIRPDGTPDKKIRPNAMVALVFKIAKNDHASIALERISLSDMLTAWGIRTLSEEDESYNPKLYHSGMVWGLTTGWTAIAAYNYKKTTLGFKLIKIQAERINSELGMYAECYLGDKPQLYHSCILQGWSMSTFIIALISGLFGIRKNAVRNTLEIHPKLPREWKKASIYNIRIGNAIIDIIIDNENRMIKVSNRGQKAVNVSTEISETVVNPGEIKEIQY